MTTTTAPTTVPAAAVPDRLVVNAEDLLTRVGWPARRRLEEHAAQQRFAAARGLAEILRAQDAYDRAITALDDTEDQWLTAVTDLLQHMISIGTGHEPVLTLTWHQPSDTTGLTQPWEPLRDQAITMVGLPRIGPS